MKKSLFILGFSASLCLSTKAFAVDHNNIDASRPLDFDDAESLALHEKSIEFGTLLTNPRKGKVGAQGSVETLYGFAPNTHLSIDFNPSYLSQNGDRRRFNFGNLGIGVFHNFNREIGSTPAFSLRADAYLPSGRDAAGVDYRLRAIASKQWHQYDRLHLNLDLGINNGASSGERHVLPGVILGYSKPLGYPTRFDRTLVAQVGYRAGQNHGDSGLLNLGVGLRQQIAVRSVLDIGLKGDVTGGAQRAVSLIAGISRQF